MRLSSLLAATSLAALAACAVGPDFTSPAKPDVAAYDSTPLPAKTDSTKGVAGTAQTFSNQEIPATWWEIFHSEPLNQIVTKSLEFNPDLAAAKANLRAAEENEEAGEGIMFPTITGGFNVTRQKTAGASFGGSFPSLVYTVHTGQLNLSYGLDVFGGNSRYIEELGAQKDFQRFELEAARISLTTNVVVAAIEEASLRGQIAATQKIIADEDHQRNVLQKQLDAGGIVKTALLAEEALLAQTRATLPPLEKQLSQTRHALSVLAGDFPSNAPAATFDFKSIALPANLPVSLPSQLVEQRPDVKAAEASLHAASAGIGVAIANRLPQITLSADVGDVANMLGKMFTPGTGIWALGGGVSQTIFDAGTLAHEQGVAEAEYDYAAAQYKKTVLGAFQDVADTLRALQSDATALKAQNAAERAAAASLKLAHQQFDAGSISYLNLLDAERTEQQARLTLVQAEAQRYVDTAALYQALGGGWWNQKPQQKEVAAATPAPTEMGAITISNPPVEGPKHAVQGWRAQ